MEVAQVGSGAEEIHVEHDVPTCVLQHLVSGNKQIVLQFGSELLYPRFYLQRRSTSHGEELILMCLCNM